VFLLELGLAAEEGHGSIIERPRRAPEISRVAERCAS
jgi:hypothetical protein